MCGGRDVNGHTANPTVLVAGYNCRASIVQFVLNVKWEDDVSKLNRDVGYVVIKTTVGLHNACE